jgi:hypothetical protein
VEVFDPTSTRVVDFSSEPLMAIYDTANSSDQNTSTNIVTEQNVHVKHIYKYQSMSANAVSRSMAMRADTWNDQIPSGTVIPQKERNL